MAAEIDFETYSEAGYGWEPVVNKWHSAAGKGKTKRGLELVGAAAYAEHPSTEVLCLYYDLNDGGGQRCWLPWMLPPADLLAYVQRGGIVEAHNSGFEFVIWYYVLHLRHGWPMLQDYQMACTKAQCRAWALPGALGKVGEVLNLPIQKDADGVRLLKKFSIPRNPTRSDRRRRELPHLDPVDGPKLYAYCGRDIEAERCVAAAVPPLSPSERELWIIDQRVNFRGVQIDIEAVELLIKQYERYAAEAEEQIQRIAGCSYSEVQKIIDWLASRKIFTASLDAEAIDTLMDRLRGSGQLYGEVWQVLKIRRDFGSSSVKKLYSLRHWVNSDHRARYLLEYHGAQTGRWAGRGPQPQNMPSKGPAVVRSECCGSIRAASLPHCPYCVISDPNSHKTEWGPEGVDRVVQDCRGAGLSNWPDPVAAISGCLRGMFIAKPGHDLISSDYSAIEAVVLAMLAGEQWRIDVFRTHGKIYEMSAAKISGVPFDEIANHKKLHGEHHPLRKGVGKVAELACFAPHTQVLTKDGYKSIIDVTPDDELWDGQQWVTSQGAVCKGKKVVITLDGVEMTPNHPINCGPFWRAAKALVLSKSTRRRALVKGSENLPLSRVLKKTGGTEFKLDVAVARGHTPSSGRICEKGKVHAAVFAQRQNRKKQRIQNTLLNIKRHYRTRSTAEGCLIGYPRLGAVAKTRLTNNTRTMAAGVLASATCGKQTKPLFYCTSKRCKGGAILNSKWTGRMLTRATNRAISGLLQERRIHAIKGRYGGCKIGSKRLSSVYDIVNAGPRNQFTIRTSSGHLIVHNSGYAGWIGAWKAFGADAFMSEQEIRQAILAWRDASPMIVEFWGGQWRKDPHRWHFTPELYGIEGAAVSAALNPGQCFAYRGVTWGIVSGVLYCQLPSGRFLTYHSPRLDEVEDQRGLKVWSLSYMGVEPTTGQWVRIPTYGGKLTENIVQAVARDILANALINLERAGYPVVLHVHDEIVSEIPQGFGSVEEFERIMATMPSWAAGWPIKAAGGWRGRRYRKD